nr:PREDICTED: uncharacterized protein LOC109644222 [Paralichthys olivaceus]
MSSSQRLSLVPGLQAPVSLNLQGSTAIDGLATTALQVPIALQDHVALQGPINLRCCSGGREQMGDGADAADEPPRDRSGLRLSETHVFTVQSDPEEPEEPEERSGAAVTPGRLDQHLARPQLEPESRSVRGYSLAPLVRFVCQREAEPAAVGGGRVPPCFLWSGGRKQSSHAAHSSGAQRASTISQSPLPRFKCAEERRGADTRTNPADAHPEPRRLELTTSTSGVGGDEMKWKCLVSFPHSLKKQN